MSEQRDSGNIGWVSVWEYRVNAAHQQEFESIYGPNGEWAKLFCRADGYLGTRLLRDSEDSFKYVTFDSWESERAFESFRNQFGTEYAELDRRCEQLTESERHLGTMTSTSR